MAVTIDGSANTITANATLTSALSTASGSAPSYSARAWVNFNGTGTVAISASGNVSSITDNGVGIFTVNFTTAMSDVNYAVSTGAADTGNGTGVFQADQSFIATTSVRIKSGVFGGFSAEDKPYTYCIIFR